MSLALTLLLAAAPEPVTVVVAGLQAKDFDAHVVEILLSDLRAAIGRSKRYALVTPEEMGAIDEELVRQLSGGCAEASCLAQLAELAEADFVVNGRLTKVGDGLVLSLKRVDVKTLAAVASVRHEAQNLGGIQDGLEALARRVLAEEPSMAILQVDARFTDKQPASHVDLYWQGKKIGQSPFDGQVPAGSGLLEAKRFGKSFVRRIDLRPRRMKAYVITTGRNPMMAKVGYGLLGLGVGVSGVAFGVLATRISQDTYEPEYGSAVLGDVLTLASAYCFYKAWSLR